MAHNGYLFCFAPLAVFGFQSLKALACNVFPASATAELRHGTMPA